MFPTQGGSKPRVTCHSRRGGGAVTCRQRLSEPSRGVSNLVGVSERTERTVPDKPSLDGLEAKWRAAWADAGTYRFDRTKTRDEVFSIDTPPPTVSGTLHPGHVCSYTHTDTVARYQRMRGREVFYPMGWDDNGLNVERRVQILTGTRCDPSLPYDPDFRAAREGEEGDRPIAVSRPNFVELCGEVVEQLEQTYFDLWSDLGLSVDWIHTLPHHRARGHPRQPARRPAPARAATSPTGPSRPRCGTSTSAPRSPRPSCRTARSRAPTTRSASTAPTARPIWIDTTRPELLPACVALVAHPDDERYQPLFGRTRHARRCSASRCRSSPTSWPSPTRAPASP